MNVAGRTEVHCQRGTAGRSFCRQTHNCKFFRHLSLRLSEFFGGGCLTLFEGFDFDQIGYLLALNCMFLFFVLVNGAFRYRINIDIGVLAESMLRRFRVDLSDVSTPGTFWEHFLIECF